MASERPAPVDSRIERLARLICVNENARMTPIRDINPTLRHSLSFTFWYKERNRTSIPVFLPYAPAFSPVSVWNCACPKPIAQSRFAHRCGQAREKAYPFTVFIFLLHSLDWRSYMLMASLSPVAYQRSPHNASVLGLKPGDRERSSRSMEASFAISSLTSAGSSTRIFFPS